MKPFDTNSPANGDNMPSEPPAASAPSAPVGAPEPVAPSAPPVANAPVIGATQVASAAHIGLQRSVVNAAPIVPQHPHPETLTPERRAGNLAHAATYKKGKLTREGMERAIRAGGSVMIHTAQGPAVITKIEDLPSEAALASGDADAESVARENIRLRRELLDAEEAKLTGQK